MRKRKLSDPRAKETLTAVSADQALTKDLWTLCLEFSINGLLTWCLMQRVSKQFGRCTRDPRALMRFVLKLDRAQVEFLSQKLGVSASGIRAVKLCLCPDTSLPELASLVALQTLDLSKSGNDITDAGLQALAPFVALQTLDLSYCEMVTDAGLQALSPLVALQTLDLSHCDKITDAGLQALAPLVALKTLGLLDCEMITDTGLEALEALAPNVCVVRFRC